MTDKTFEPILQNTECSCASHDTVDQMFAFLVIDPEDHSEGVPALQTPQGPMPLMGADIERASSYEQFVQQLATAMNIRVELVRFGNREHVKWIEP